MSRLHKLEQDYRDATGHIYGLAHNVCINGEEQNALVTALQNIELEGLKDGADGQLIIRNMLFTIVDGLAYGNWPWIKNGVNTLEVKKD